MRHARLIAGHALRESLRRRVFAVVLVLTVAFLALYALGTWHAFSDVEEFTAGSGSPLDVDELAGAPLLGLAMFCTLFLGAVLACFLTLGAVRGDAERGLLQPIVVRPAGRLELLAGRFLGAALVCAAYVLCVYGAAVAITGASGGWWPDRLLGPGLALALGVAIIAALSLLGSVFLSSTANGIAVLMVFGAGLAAGLLGQIGDALDSDTLEDIARIASWALPFEALYQAGLSGLTADARGLTGAAIELGPFGGAREAGFGLVAWAVGYVGVVGALAGWAFGRRDL